MRRLSAAAAGGALAATAFVTAGATVRSAPNPNPTMIPILEVKRLTSADHVFIDKALAMAVSSMAAANAEIGVAGTTDVQDEAVRSFNTSAAAYNALAEIAAKRDMKFPKPEASQLDDTPALAQDAKPGPQDVKYVGATHTGLQSAIDLYYDEARHGKDKLARDFAAQMRPRLEHDLELVTIDIENMNHPKPPPTEPPMMPAGPDPASTRPSGASPGPSASP